MLLFALFNLRRGFTYIYLLLALQNIKATTAVFSPVNIVENGVITKSFHIIYSSDYGTTINNTIYGFTNNIEKLKLQTEDN